MPRGSRLNPLNMFGILIQAEGAVNTLSAKVYAGKMCSRVIGTLGLFSGECCHVYLRRWYLFSLIRRWRRRFARLA